MIYIFRHQKSCNWFSMAWYHHYILTTLSFETFFMFVLPPYLSIIVKCVIGLLRNSVKIQSLLASCVNKKHSISQLGCLAADPHVPEIMFRFNLFKFCLSFYCFYAMKIYKHHPIINSVKIWQYERWNSKESTEHSPVAWIDFQIERQNSFNFQLLHCQNIFQMLFNLDALSFIT